MRSVLKLRAGRRMRRVGQIVLGCALATAHAALASTQIVPLAATDLVWDAARGRIWASVPGNGGTYANSIVAIDPATGGLGPSLYVGSGPGELAISADAEKLYVALDGAASIVRIDLSGLALELEIPLGADSDGGLYRAGDIAVQPGGNSTIAVTRGENVAIFDGAVRRAQTARLRATQIVFGASAAQLFAADGNSSSSELHELQVGPAGVSLQASTPGLLYGFESDLVFEGGWIFGSRGTAANAATAALAGAYEYVSLARGVASDGAAGEVSFIGQRAVVIFDRTKFLSIGTVPVAHLQGLARGFVQTGSRAWALSTHTGQVYLVRADPGSTDGDQDGIPDALDNCPTTANASQLNDDADELGNACEVFGPNDPVVLLPLCTTALSSATFGIGQVQTQIGQQQALVDTASAELAYCQAPTDADADGHPDRTDRCSTTAAGASTDEGGCSQAQFCALESVSSCTRGDFRNDETGRKKPKDCRVVASVCQAF